MEKIQSDVGQNLTSENLALPLTLESELEKTPLILAVKSNTGVTTKMYDGKKLIAGSAVLETELVEDDELSLKITKNSVVDVGSTTSETYVKVLRSGEDVTDQYAVSIKEATLSITERDAKLASESKSFMYDGTAHTAETVAVSGSGFVVGEGATYSNFVAVTFVGDSVENTFTYTLNENTKEQNYSITQEYGVLSVTARATNIKLLVDPITKMYDGTNTIDQSTIVWDYESEMTLVEGDTISFNVTTDRVDAGNGNIKVSDRKMTNADGRDVTNCYTWDGINTGGIVITKRDVKLSSGSGSWEYDGLAHSVESVIASGSNFVAGEGASYSDYAAITYAGVINNTFAYTLDEGTKAGNYAVEQEYGTLEITARQSDIAITVNALEKLYDGNSSITLTDSDWSYTTASGKELIAGDTLSITISNHNVDAGSYSDFEVVYKVTNAEGKDVTNCYTFADVVTNGLTINKRNVTLTSGSASKPYDGTPITNNTVTVSGDGFIVGEGATWSVTGTQTEVGSSANTFEYELNAGTKEGNYNITKVEGTLEITGYNVPVTLTVDDFQRVYTGGTAFTLKSSEYSVEGLRANDHIGTISVTAADANVGNDKSYTISYRIYNSDGEDVTSEYTNLQTPVLGQFDILKRSITVKADSATKVYDNTDLVCDSYTVVGELAEGEQIDSVQITGSARHVSDSTIGNNQIDDIVIKNAQGDDVTANYEITEVDGNLIITQRTVTLRGGSASKVYDGKALTLHKVTQCGYLDGDGAVYLFPGMQSEVGTSINEFSYIFRSQIGSEEGDYKFVTEYGTLEIIQPDSIKLVVTADSLSKVYDGETLSCDTYTLTQGALLEGDKLAVTVEGSITRAGVAANNVVSCKVMRNGIDVSSWYDITTVSGTLEVTKRDLYLISGTAWKEYDGIALTDGHITENGFVNGDGAIYHITGTRTECGSSPNTFTYDAIGRTDMSNYNVHTVNGTLTVGSQSNTVRSDIDGNGISDILLRYSVDNSIGYWMNEPDGKWWNYSENQPYSDSFKVLGMVDMNADGYADTVTLRQNGKTLLAGYFDRGGTDGWVTIKEINSDEGLRWNNTVANVTGNIGTSSIVWQNSEVGAVGAWLDGTSEWVRAEGYYGDGWKLAGAADLDGLGRETVLMTYANKLYSVDIMAQTEAQAEIELDNWKVSAVGDFDNDNRDELILTRDNDVILFDKGNAGNEWRTVGQLGDGWQVVGAGDYNGDGFDDVLLHDTKSGIVGCWYNADNSKWKYIGDGVSENWSLLA